MTSAAVVFAVLASIGRAEAVTKFEQIAFAGIDTLQVLVYQKGSENLVSERQLRTKAEFVLRTAGVPVDADHTPRRGPWLEISVVAYEMKREDGRGTGAWCYGVLIGLYEVVGLWRDGQERFLDVATWRAPMIIGNAQRDEARHALLVRIAEVAEEVSNLYLATH